MSSENGNSSGGGGMAFAAGLLFGTLVGAATAVFLAPASGRELRDTLRRNAKLLVVRASEAVPDEWMEVAEEEITKEILDNVESIRSAGL